MLGALPIDVQLLIFLNVFANDLNALRLTCKSFRNIIDQQDRVLYKRLVNIQVYVNSTFALFVNYNWGQLRLQFTEGLCNYASAHRRSRNGVFASGFLDEERTSWAEETFSSLTLEKCKSVLLQRSCGILTFELHGNISNAQIMEISPLLAEARDLVLKSGTIDYKFAFEFLSAPRGSLTITDYCGELRDLHRIIMVGGLVLTGRKIYITDAQLLTLVERQDIHELKIRWAVGPTIETMISVIRTILHSTKTVDIACAVYGFSQLVDANMIGEEHVVFESGEEVEYTRGSRRVTVRTQEVSSRRMPWLTRRIGGGFPRTVRIIT